jgi:pyruvate ferredoxin oxidoreductase beta subunit
MATSLALKELAKRGDRISPGHRVCAGCTAPIVVRMVLNAIDEPVVVANATGCLEVSTALYPYTAWRVPWIHSAFENAAATMAGVEAMYKSLRRQGKLEREIRFVVFGGDGGTYDIGLQALSGALERGHKMMYVCYDNEAYMNTGIQRSGSTPHAAMTTTSPPGRARMGKRHLKKDLLAIIGAHHIPYAASASVAYPRDLQRKVRRAMGITGPTFLLVHSPCPLGWGHGGELTIEVGRLAVQTGLFPLVEIERGSVTGVMPLRAPRPVSDYLALQGRFKHLFADDPRALEEREHLQALADHNIAVYGLQGEAAGELDADGADTVRRGGAPL